MPVEPVPLTDDEIRERYGSLILSALAAFTEDPSYLIDMAEHGTLIRYKRALWSVRMDVQKAVREAQMHYVTNGRACRAVCGQLKKNARKADLCGFGPCAYAQPEFEGVLVKTVEQAVSVIAESRGVKQPPRLSRTHR